MPAAARALRRGGPTFRGSGGRMTRQTRTLLIMAVMAAAAVVLLGMIAGRYEKTLASRMRTAAPVTSPAR